MMKFVWVRLNHGTEQCRNQIHMHSEKATQECHTIVKTVPIIINRAVLFQAVSKKMIVSSFSVKLPVFQWFFGLEKIFGSAAYGSRLGVYYTMSQNNDRRYTLT